MKILTAEIAALYYGCEVQFSHVTYDDDEEIIIEYFEMFGVTKHEIIVLGKHNKRLYLDFKDCKLVLREVQDMTKEEVGGLSHNQYLYRNGWKGIVEELKRNIEEGISLYSHDTDYLRKIGVDCDGLIGLGLAVKKQTV